MATKQKPRTPEEKQALVKQVKELSQTVSVPEACKQAGVSVERYYAWRRLSPKAKRKQSKPQHVTLEVLPQKARMRFVAFTGDPGDVMAAIAALPEFGR